MDSEGEEQPPEEVSDDKIWTKGGAAGRLGAQKKGLTTEDIDKMKNMSGDEQVRYMNQVFNFYAMDDNSTNQNNNSTIANETAK